MFAGKSPEQVRAVLDALRNQVEATPLQFEHQGKPTTTKVTVSIGVAEKNREFKTPDEVMKAADQALYQAKEMGRNRIYVYSSDGPIASPWQSGQDLPPGYSSLTH